MPRPDSRWSRAAVLGGGALASILFLGLALRGLNLTNILDALGDAQLWPWVPLGVTSGSETMRLTLGVDPGHIPGAKSLRERFARMRTAGRQLGRDAPDGDPGEGDSGEDDSGEGRPEDAGARP